MGEWTTITIVKDVLLFLLAVYGAALSTFNWRQSIRKEQRIITVNLSTAMPTYPDGSVGPCFAKLEAINTGHRTVNIVTLAIELPTGGRLYPTMRSSLPGILDTPLPATLSDGQSAHLFMAYRDIAAALIQSGRTEKIKLTPVCEDSAGGVHKGAPWDVDPHQFSRM